ncbi:hypothetical protein FBU31_001487 [Coemansia sp. 'formosensis']|nr:hypothetical protein FBU31_001487 [Coemansia sp. 'formosensis']
MARDNNFGKQDQYTIKDSAPTAFAKSDTREDKLSASTPVRQGVQDPSRGLSISGQGKPAHTSSNRDTATALNQQHTFKALPSSGLVIAGKSSTAQQSKPKDKPHRQQKQQHNGTARKRANSSASLEIVGAAPQPKPRHQRQHQPASTKAANIGCGVSISGTAQPAPASKLDANLPLTHVQQEAGDGADAKRLKISGERKKRSLFGYRMESMLMHNAVSNNNHSISSHEPQGQPRAADNVKTVVMDVNSPVAMQTTPTQCHVGLASTAPTNDSSGRELKIARGATSKPGTMREDAGHGSNIDAAPFSLRIANSSA